MEVNAILWAGIARQVITPPKGIFLIGYGDRTKGNIGVHDDLTATTLVLTDEKTRLAIVALDMLALNEFIVDQVRSRLPGIELLLCCSHTHSGPIAYADRKSPLRNQRYIEQLVEKITLAVRTAEADLRPACLAWSQGEADIAINRRELQPDGRMEIGRNPDGVVDRSLQMVSVLQEDGQRLATLVNYACHGTVLGPDNLLVSADWIGAMRQKVEAELGGLVLYLQGATGNLNPDMYWKDARAFHMMQEEGERVAVQVITILQQGMETLKPLPLQVNRTEVWLPLEVLAMTPQPPKVNYRLPLLRKKGYPGWMGFWVDHLLDKRYPWRPRVEARDGLWSVPMRINVVRLGELALVTFAAEVFTEIGLQVKAQSPAPYTLFASLTDGCISYLPTAVAHIEGGYEVDEAPLYYRYPGRLSMQCERISLEETRRMQEELWGL